MYPGSEVSSVTTACGYGPHNVIINGSFSFQDVKSVYLPVTAVSLQENFTSFVCACVCACVRLTDSIPCISMKWQARESFHMKFIALSSHIHENVTFLFPTVDLIENTRRCYETYPLLLPRLLKQCASIAVEVSVLPRNLIQSNISTYPQRNTRIHQDHHTKKRTQRRRICNINPVCDKRTGHAVA
jgi:hypothetical protein